MQAKDLLALIKNRRSIYPNMYTDQVIDQATISSILEAANWAPNHKKTEPWRFKVFRGAALQRLADYLGAYYKLHTPEALFSEMKYKKTVKKPVQSSCVIALCMQRDPEESLPQWEEEAALAMAVQNMWLMCTALKIGSYWSSPRSIIEARNFLQLKEGEACYGLFFMGYHQAPELKAERGAIEEKIDWIEE
jgi:nitroreductase